MACSVVLVASCGLSVQGTFGASTNENASDSGERVVDVRGSSPGPDVDDEGGIGRSFEDASVTDGPTTDAPPPPPPPCKGSAGPTGIKIGTYCIDRTEVTRAQYATFLPAAATVTQSAKCSWNTSFPTVSVQDNLPVTNVDWCDAQAYCIWAGKRLCTKAEASNGCSTGDLYPYGPAHEVGRCNDKSANRDAAVPVASLTCVGALGVHDMVGNVVEWIDSCEKEMGANDKCDLGYGGSWQSDLPCDTYIVGFTRSSVSNDVGFRCCSDVQ
jgi:formylglycine-generating enzyme required for sulfatase activity